MQLEPHVINLILSLLSGFFLGVVICWFFLRIRYAQLIKYKLTNLNIQHDAEQKITDVELENLENELDLLRQQLADKEQIVLNKMAELSKMNELRAIYATRAAQNNDYKEALQKTTDEVQQLRDEAYGYQKKLSEVQIKADEKLKAAQLIIDNLEHSKQQLVEQFELLANKIFTHNSSELKQSNQHEISQLLTPFKDHFTDFKRKIEELHELDSRDRISLQAQVKQLSSLNRQISEDTINLTRALKGDVKFQGNWGEMVLENLLEHSGLRKDIEYKLQPSFRGQDHHLLRPDALISLPDNKTIIIDSKVSLKAYTCYVSAIDDKQQKEALKDHVQSLKNHIKVLSSKDYSAIDELQCLDFVLLFVPIEQALMLVINEEPEMVFNAFEKKIIIVSTTTLLATVRTIESFWRYDRQQSNAEEIAKRAGDMLDKFSLFVAELENIGRQLDRAKESYNTAHNRLASGNGNLMSRAKIIQELGIKPKKI